MLDQEHLSVLVEQDCLLADRPLYQSRAQNTQEKPRQFLHGGENCYHDDRLGTQGFGSTSEHHNIFFDHLPCQQARYRDASFWPLLPI